jgi:hypothetical protein
MAMRFPYQLRRLTRPAWTLMGRMHRPKPIVPASITGPFGTRGLDCLLDTAADDTVFPDTYARLLRIDLTNAPTGEAGVVGGAVVPVRFAAVMLRISDGREHRAWPARVAFTAARLTWPLLGFAGCLQFFGAFFDGEREEVELRVNGLYPGT